MSWVQRCAVGAIVVVLGCLASTVQPEPSYALVDGIQTQLDWSIVNDWLKDDAAAELIDDANKRTRWARVRAGLSGYGVSGLTASAGITLPTVAVTAGGLAFGWELAHATGLSSWASGTLLGLGQPSAVGTITGGNWISYTCGVGVNDYTPCPDLGYGTSGQIWAPRSTGSNPCPDEATSSLEVSWGSTFTGCTQVNNDAKLAWMDAVGASTSGAVRVTGDCAGTAGDGNNDCVRWFFGFSELMGNATFSELRTYNSTSDASKKTATIAGVPRPSGYNYGDAGADAAEAELENDPVLGPAIGTILHPDESDTGSPDETLTLPRPLLGETAANYRARLRALGFLGTIVLDPLGEFDALPEFGPNVVTRLSVTTTTGTELYPMLDPWPDPPPTLTVPGTTTTVTIQHNPETAPAPAPGDPGSPADPPPGNAPPPGGGGTINVGDCSCPAPDFSPFTSPTYGDKFPFGVVAEVDGLLGTTLFASPDAPSWSFDFTAFSAGGFGPYDLGTYEVDLEILDTYAGMIRTLLSWCIWVGGLWWFGSRWFGFKGTGDPGEVVDEAWS